MIICIRLILLVVVFPLKTLLILPTALVSEINSGNERELTSFEAISDGKKVIVSWTSFSEKTFDYYAIEKSKDGIHFYPALMIKSAGKVTNLFEYTDIDYSPFTGISYYRLRQNGYLGDFFYSPTIVVNCQISKEGLVVSNSEDKRTQKDFIELEGKPALVVVRDSKGEEFISKILLTSQNEVLYASDTKNQLKQGNYFVVASSCNPLYHQKLIIK